MRTTLLVLLALPLAACGKSDPKTDPAPQGQAEAKAKAKDEAAGCPALAITVDGKPLSGSFRGVAVTAENAGYKTQLIHLYDHDKFACEEELKGRHTPVDNEVFVKAFHGAYPGVGIGAYTHLEGKLTLDRPPGKVGEPLEICVREPVQFTPNAGSFSGKKVSIVGKFAGKYCGVWKS
jgi:hypothetical protein